VNTFAAVVAGERSARMPWKTWTKELRAIRMAGLARQEYEGLNLSDVMHTLAELLEDDAILTCDAGNFATWPPRFINFKDNQRFIGPTNGAMGYGVPAAIAACLAEPGRLALCFAGDGDFQMTCQELATAAQHGAAPLILILDNGIYGTIRAHQERQFPARVFGTTMVNPDFSALAKAYGFHAERVETTATFAPAFERAVAAVKAGTGAVLTLTIAAEAIAPRQRISTLREAALAKR